MRLHDELRHYGVLGMKWGVRKTDIRNSNHDNEQYFLKEASKATAKATRARRKGKLDKAKYFEEYAKLALKRAKGKRLSESDKALKQKIYREKLITAQKIGLLSVPVGKVSGGVGSVLMATAALAYVNDAHNFENRAVILED